MLPDHLIQLKWSVVRGPFHKQFFHRNSNSIEISICSHQSCIKEITMKYCTEYNSCAVVACVKINSDLIPYNGVTLKPIIHQIWIMMENSFLKWAPLWLLNGYTMSDHWWLLDGIGLQMWMMDSLKVDHKTTRHLVIYMFILWYGLPLDSKAGWANTHCCLGLVWRTTWWYHYMETLSMLLAFVRGKSK